MNTIGNNTISFGITVAAIITFGVTLVTANSAAAGKLSVSLPRVNYTAWTSQRECDADQPNMGCGYLGDVCNGHKVYMAAFVFKAIIEATRTDGVTADIIEMRPDGYFGDTLCTLAKT